MSAATEIRDEIIQAVTHASRLAGTERLIFEKHGALLTKDDYAAVMGLTAKAVAQQATRGKCLVAPVLHDNRYVWHYKAVAKAVDELGLA